MNEVYDYKTQAEQFLKNTGTTMSIKFKVCDYYFDDDKEPRNIYTVTLRRKGYGQWSFTFGNSIDNTRKEKVPSQYDILTCITKDDPGSFEEFCWSYGFNVDSIKDLKIYKKVCKEYKNVLRLFEDVLDQLGEIQ